MIHGADMGPIWGRQDQGGPHVGSMNFAIWDHIWRKTALRLRSATSHIAEDYTGKPVTLEYKKNDEAEG